MSAKHTPGPWEVQGYNLDNHILIGIAGNQSNTGKIAHARYNGADNIVEQRANAKLIASAPELLEALELVIITCEIEKVNADYGQNPNHWTNKVINAIRKATE